MSATDPVRLTGEDLDGEEGWQRLGVNPELHGVEAIKNEESGWPWQITVWVAEFVREEPLETELVTSVERALRAVPGVVEVVHEDREVWGVSGEPSGEVLCRAVAQAVDEIAPRIQESAPDL